MDNRTQRLSSVAVHGGNLERAQEWFGEPADGWQDLSTGISPWSYPVPDIPGQVWQQLPGEGTALKAAAAQYYGVDCRLITPLPGSQYAIARVPHQLSPATVALPALGYAEHQRAWLSAGHRPVLYRDIDHLMVLVSERTVKHLVVLNPNNPSAETLGREAIRQLYDAHQQRGLFLLDEAFVDLQPECSAAALIEPCPDLWVLRSVGKFFGLAGIRLGFLLGRGERWCVSNAVAAELQPWGVSHLAQWVGCRALGDSQWQSQQRRRLRSASLSLEAQWQRYCAERPGFFESGGSVANGGLFVTLRGDRESLYALYCRLGRAGVLLRWCHESTETRRLPWLRCGLPSDGGERLNRTLMEASSS